MKLSKSTTILINLVLIVMIAILVKAFVGFPKSANAASPTQYKVVHTNLVQVEATLDTVSKEGWKFVTWGLWTPGPNVTLLFER
jgi:hypothetical protein